MGSKYAKNLKRVEDSKKKKKKAVKKTESKLSK